MTDERLPAPPRADALDASRTAHPSVEFYESRARWYRGGCDGLEGGAADYRASGDLERDAAADILALCSRVRDLERAAALDASPAPRLAQTAKQYAAERRETIMALRAICGEFGDLDWTDDLHLADIVNKHLAPYLHERRAAPADPERP